ncbi:hypothetical protein DL96DRAFT_1564643 [Flagelloscypha sp. PMI_526]|nr:hypothetical protein DL96DRAFT_1564643 [Flagelloscypha sp. PMI_526]
MPMLLAQLGHLAGLVRTEPANAVEYDSVVRRSWGSGPVGLEMVNEAGSWRRPKTANYGTRWSIRSQTKPNSHRLSGGWAMGWVNESRLDHFWLKIDNRLLGFEAGGSRLRMGQLEAGGSGSWVHGLDQAESKGEESWSVNDAPHDVKIVQLAQGEEDASEGTREPGHDIIEEETRGGRKR